MNDEDAFSSGLAAIARGLRRDEGVPQRVIAERSRLGKNLISRIENGKANPRVSQLDALGRALGLSGARELQVRVEEYILRSADTASQQWSEPSGLLSVGKGG